MALRSGFVSIVGRPNAGKSTLLNALLGQKLAIVTHKPQTTRTRVLGIVEQPAVRRQKGTAGSPAAQIVLVDTPGIHQGPTALDRRMLQEVQDALEGRDVVLFLVDVTHRLPPGTAESAPARGRSALSHAEDAFALSLVRALSCPVILVLNKMDAVPRQALLPVIAHWSALHAFSAVVPISARKKQGLDTLLRSVVALLPEGQRFFPRDQVTDQPERFLAAEIVREKVLLLTGEEVPHAAAVVVERWEEPQATPTPAKAGRQPPLTRITAAILCERTGQKAILIGKGGAMLKQIGTAARKDIEALLGHRVFLELFVKVVQDWRGSRTVVDQLDWRRQMEQMSQTEAERPGEQR